MSADIKTESLWLMKGDCLERMKEIESGSVDLILTDPPYDISNSGGGMMGKSGRKFIEQTCLACMAATAGVSLLGISACSTTQVLKTASTNGNVLIDKASFLAEKEAKALADKKNKKDKNDLLQKLRR